MSTITKDPFIDQVSERAARRHEEEFKRRTIEIYKQTDRYKEYEKRKRAEIESEKPKEE